MPIRSGPAILAAVAVVGLGGAVAAAPTASAETAPRPLIIDGSIASSAPWAAAVYAGGFFTCSGFVVADRYVLTAQHCVRERMSVRVGSVLQSSGGILAEVVGSVSRYDLALLELDRSAGTPAVALADADPPVGSTTTIYGWGMTCRDGCGASEQLKVATVRYDRPAEDNLGGPALQSSRIDGTAWSGDSGGPQFHDGEVVGVASTADGVSIQNYSSVAASIDWIRSVIGGGTATVR